MSSVSLPPSDGSDPSDGMGVRRRKFREMMIRF